MGNNKRKMEQIMSKEARIIGMYSPLSGTGKIYDYRNVEPIGDGFTSPVVIWDKKCSYKKLCEETKKLQEILKPRRKK